MGSLQSELTFFLNSVVLSSKSFQATHNKAYGKEEDAERFEIYKANLAMIEEHNKKYDNGETSYKMGENHMTDWKPEEKSRMLGLRPPSDQQ